MSSDEEKNVERIRPKINFYQNDEYVFCEIMVRNIRPGHATIKFRERELSFIYLQQKTPEDPTLKEALYELYVDLAEQILPEDSSYQITPMKATIKLKKAVDKVRWAQLERNLENETIIQRTPSVEETSTTSASSANPSGGDAHTPKKTATRDWDRLAREVEKEEEDESDSVDALFKKIYAQSDEETRRAMVKSMVESNGTVLSTNWAEVGKGQVEPKPPTDVEFKPWDK